MEMQEVFETVCRHLAKQNSQAFVENYGCMYRTHGGKMCAVGCLIKDEHYTPNIEDSIADDPSVISALSDSGIDTRVVSVWFLLRLQEVHDMNKYYVDNPKVISHLEDLAGNYGLEFKPVEWGLKQ